MQLARSAGINQLTSKSFIGERDAAGLKDWLCCVKAGQRKGGSASYSGEPGRSSITAF
jgi:hypothetical protein